jgi:hypothetical protein
MGIFWGIVLVVLGVVCWGGQAVSWLAPPTAVRLGLSEAEQDVEPTFWADIRGEAAWDALTLWTLPVAGILLMLDSSSWAYFGLVGGGMYLYFAGRGIWTRVVMLRRGLRIGDPSQLPVAIAFLAIWGVVAAITIVAALVALEA